MTGSPSGINTHLVGVPGGRLRLNTPALVLDLDIFENNVRLMAEHCRKRGIALRPHAKSHKSVEIAKRQRAAGAIGLCCAKLGEAEALAEGGIDNILLTSPIVTKEALHRLGNLNGKLTDLMVVADSRDGVAALGEAARAGGKKLKIFLDLDVGLHRTGARPGDQAYAVAADIAAHEALEFVGVQAYAGHLQHLDNVGERRTKSLAAMDILRNVRDELTRRNLAPRILSGGGTGTCHIDPDADVLTELQAGSYVFMDREYNDVWTKTGERPPFETSLFVQTTVISTNTDGLVTTDAGLKSFATDAGQPVIAAGAPEGAAYFYFGDEQGGVLFKNKTDRLAVGSVVSCVVPHCDPTVNLYDHYHVVRGSTLEAIWPIEARGRSQ
jgi:3-hydroxy-D-aspartate aldolase